MRLLVRACGAVVSVAMAVFAGCGGNVILDSSAGGTGGAATGGTGGTTTPTTSVPTTTTTSITTTSITTTTTTITTTSITTTTSTGPSTCDNSGDCGDGQSGCIGCALNSDCFQSYDACINETECIDYSTCLNDCMDEACQQQCMDQYPVGGQLYQSLVLCVFCFSCPNDCGQMAACPN